MEGGQDRQVSRIGGLRRAGSGEKGRECKPSSLLTDAAVLP